MLKISSISVLMPEAFALPRLSRLMATSVSFILRSTNGNLVGGDAADLGIRNQVSVVDEG